MINLEQIKEADARAVSAVIAAKPHWLGVIRARELIPELSGKLILHAGPPIAYGKMCGLHRRGMQSAALFEGWAKTNEEADRLLASGQIALGSAFDYPTVGSGAGIITGSVPLLLVEDETTGKQAGVFPHEGKFGGGFCGWGLYSSEIKENLEYMATALFADITERLRACGGLPLAEIIHTGLGMGDENHSSQTAVDALFLRAVVPLALQCRNHAELLTYFAETKRFFHNFCQAACRSALLSAEGIIGSGMVVAAGGNGVEYGIKVSGTGNRWFTAPSPMIEGKIMVEGAKFSDRVPWLGDSSVVECAGLGGILSAASPVVCSFRGDSVADGARITSEMAEISIARHPDRPIPNLDFALGPVGLDVRKIVKTGILPLIDGGMLNRDGGWIGAGCARIPMACFRAAHDALNQ